MEDGTDISERYDKLLSCWPSSIEQIRILILGREHPVKLPLPFLQGTRVNSWGTINWLLNCIVNQEGQLAKGWHPTG